MRRTARSVALSQGGLARRGTPSSRISSVISSSQTPISSSSSSSSRSIATIRGIAALPSERRWRSPATTSLTSRQTMVGSRKLSIHEYQGQELMREMGIRVPNGFVASSVDEAYKIAKKIKDKDDSLDIIVKAQILAGGRGLGHFDSGLKGGVQVCTTAEDVKAVAASMLGHRLYTKQTGPEGKPCNQVFLVERHFVRRETYLAVLLDRAYNGPVIIGSARGGTDIETLSKEQPDAVFHVPVDINEGLTQEKLDAVVNKLGFQSSRLKTQAMKLITKFYELFIKYDCTMAEINPLIEDHQGQVVAVDAKLRFDPNALYRQPRLLPLKDESQEDPREVQAHKYDLNYIQLKGNIGCLVNGAGLAMATMDLIKLNGGAPANFLDVGGGATEKQVTEAFKLLSSDKDVKAILVNIFGGIMRCDVIALGIINAVKQLELKIPLVVRLQGTNVKEAREILDNSGMRIIAATNLDDAAEKAVNVAKIMNMAAQANLSVSFELPL